MYHYKYNTFLMLVLYKDFSLSKSYVSSNLDIITLSTQLDGPLYILGSFNRDNSYNKIRSNYIFQ